MPLINIKGRKINANPVRDSFNRRAVQYQNRIITAIRSIGVIEDDIDIDFERMAIKRSPASVTFYFNNYYMYYSYSAGSKFVDNLFVVMNVIERFTFELLNEEISFEDFIDTFSEDEDVLDKRKEARRLLGIHEDSIDMELINQKYKKLAKSAHPDMDGGSEEAFKQLNRAHKLLRKELA